MKRFSIGRLLGAVLMMINSKETPASTGHIENLQIEVGANWHELADGDPEQRMFRSTDGAITVTVSSMKVNIRPDQTEQLAVKLAQLRLKGHEEWQIQHGGHAEITEPVFKEHSWGHHLEYDGRDSDNRVFSFVGFVTTHQVVNIFAEGPNSGSASATDYMHSAVQEFIQSVKFAMPKIR
jgi:hypothetical protein